MVFYYVYILQVSNKGKRSFYTGYTKDLQNRLNQHIRGLGAKYCKGKKVELKYFETYMTQSEAMRREIEIKSLSRQQKLNLIKSIDLSTDKSS